MHHTPIFLNLVTVLQEMTVFRQAAHRYAGGQQLHIGMDMLMCVLHGRYHIWRWSLIADPPATRDVHADAIAADQICVEADDFIVLYQPRTTFLKLRVGARS